MIEALERAYAIIARLKRGDYTALPASLNYLKAVQRHFENATVDLFLYQYNRILRALPEEME